MPCQSSGVVQAYPRSREIARTVRDWQGKTGHVREGVAGIAVVYLSAADNSDRSKTG
jgi:hypothetical protein